MKRMLMVLVLAVAFGVTSEAKEIHVIKPTTISIPDNAAGSEELDPLVAFLQGVPNPHSVLITYVASVDAGANTLGTYQFYRAAGACPATGVPTGLVLIGTATNTALSFTDAGVPAGTWCYVATFKDNTAVESADSNNAQAVVLPPPQPPTGVKATVK